MRSKVAITIAALFMSIFSVPAFANHVNDCYLPVKDPNNHQRVGWPRDPDVLSSMGEQKIIVIPVDFPDAVSKGLLGTDQPVPENDECEGVARTDAGSPFTTDHCRSSTGSHT